MVQCRLIIFLQNNEKKKRECKIKERKIIAHICWAYMLGKVESPLIMRVYPWACQFEHQRGGIQVLGFLKQIQKRKKRKKAKQLCKGGIAYLTSKEQQAIEQLPTRLMSPSPPLLLRSNLIAGGYIPCIIVAEIDIQEYCFLKEDMGHMAEYLQSYCQIDTKGVNV